MWLSRRSGVIVWMRDALLSLGKVPDLPSDADGMRGSMVPIMSSKVWNGILMGGSGPLFVQSAESDSIAQVTLNPRNMHYTYMADYQRHEANVVEILDLPELTGSIEKSLRKLCRSATRDTFEFYKNPDAAELYKFMIKIVLLRQMTESPYLAAQYREMLRYGAQQAAFRTGVVVDARAALMKLIDATSSNHNEKVDAQNSSDRKAAELMAEQERKSREAAAKAQAERENQERRRQAADVSYQKALNMSSQLAADIFDVEGQLKDAANSKTDAERKYKEAQNLRRSVEKTQEQLAFERNAAEDARKRFNASSALAEELQGQVDTAKELLEQNIQDLNDEIENLNALRDAKLEQNEEMLAKAEEAEDRISELTAKQHGLVDTLAELITRRDNALYDMNSDQRELTRIENQIKLMSGDVPDPTGALNAKRNKLLETKSNVTRYSQQTESALARDVKNKVCLKNAAPPPGAAGLGASGLGADSLLGSGSSLAGASAAAQWYPEDGQVYDFKSYKKIDLDRDDSEEKSAGRCYDACKADPDCWIMTHRKPGDKGLIPQQGECWFGGQEASKNFEKKGDGRSFSAVKKAAAAASTNAGAGLASLTSRLGAR